MMSRLSRTSIVAALVALTAIGASTPTTGSAAAETQRTLFDHTASQTASSYWEPNVSQPVSYKSPINYSGGKAYLKLEVLSKPSAKAMQPQVCFWRHTATQKFKYETCSPARLLTFTKPGTYWISLGTMEGWWKKNGGYDWSQRASLIRIMLKDPVTGKLFLSNRCGAACYRGGDLGQHVPVRFSGEMIMVAKGAELQPPADWAGCPDAWSSGC